MIFAWGYPVTTAIKKVVVCLRKVFQSDGTFASLSRAFRVERQQGFRKGLADLAEGLC